ncbi:hypothetical protein GOP47_0014020 [Adiantum capillus-veneris]|uniref:Exostosin GT47 domain-containing protein n=1 Tax=Adiantum capillus-veneris TaxID=13818 RepID=A0A9D4ZDX8_ADICA|nr:hypothetical protein GOP47_0014020 [Adiantum capillus-veneris]
MMRMQTCKHLGFFCALTLLIFLLFIQIYQLLNFPIFNHTVRNRLINAPNFCHFSAFKLRIHPPHSLNFLSAACNCSNPSIDYMDVHNDVEPSPPDLYWAQEPALSVMPWHAEKFWHGAKNFPACTMDTCFNFTRCSDMTDFRIYAYGPPYEPISFLQALNTTPWITRNASEACIFIVTEPQLYVSDNRPHPSMLPYWSGGLNHVIATLSDSWGLTGPPAHTIGNASVLGTCLQETTYRKGFDISMPLPGWTHFNHLQALDPWSRKYFLTFKGTRYLGNKEGNFRSDPVFHEMHNARDVIIAFTCNQVTNNRLRMVDPNAGERCDADELRYKQYEFRDLMNSTFGLAPAGRSSSSYRLIETMSAGAIPVLIADNYVKPFESLIQWHQCMVQIPTAEVGRILHALRGMSREEVERRQKYCLFVYNEYLKDDATLAASIIKSLKLRFYGMLPQFNQVLPTPTGVNDGGN